MTNGTRSRFLTALLGIACVAAAQDSPRLRGRFVYADGSGAVSGPVRVYMSFGGHWARFEAGDCEAGADGAFSHALPFDGVRFAKDARPVSYRFRIADAIGEDAIVEAAAPATGDPFQLGDVLVPPPGRLRFRLRGPSDGFEFEGPGGHWKPLPRGAEATAPYRERNLLILRRRSETRSRKGYDDYDYVYVVVPPVAEGEYADIDAVRRETVPFELDVRAFDDLGPSAGLGAACVDREVRGSIEYLNEMGVMPRAVAAREGRAAWLGWLRREEVRVGALFASRDGPLGAAADVGASLEEVAVELRLRRGGTVLFRLRDDLGVPLAAEAVRFCDSAGRACLTVKSGDAPGGFVRYVVFGDPRSVRYVYCGAESVVPLAADAGTVDAYYEGGATYVLTTELPREVLAGAPSPFRIVLHGERSDDAWLTFDWDRVARVATEPTGRPGASALRWTCSVALPAGRRTLRLVDASYGAKEVANEIPKSTGVPVRLSF